MGKPSAETVMAIALFALVYGGYYAWGAYEEHSKKAESLSRSIACEASPACQDRTAWVNSLAYARTVQSRTGRNYFNGIECSTDCQSEISGYQWADAATKCATQPDQEAKKGCLAFFSKYHSDDTDPNDDPPDDNQPGISDFHGY